MTLDLSLNERRLLRMQLGVQNRGDGSTHRGLIDDQLIEGAIRLVESSGVLQNFPEWHDAERKGPGGAPSVLGADIDGVDNRDRVLLVMMFVLQRLGEAPQMTEVANALRERLSPQSLRRLNIPLTIRTMSRIAVKHQVHRAWRRFTAVCDPFPTTAGGRRMERWKVEELKELRDEAAAQVKVERLRLVMNTLLEATWQLLEPETRCQWTGHVSFDATPILVWGRRGSRTQMPKPTDSMSPEWDADWYHLPNAPQVWAYALHLTVTVPDPYAPGRFPVLAIAASMDTPKKRNDVNAVAMLQSIVDRGHPVGDAVSDRAYFAGSTAVGFNRPARALGYRLVGDYRGNQIGLQATYAGAILVDGNLYSPGLPQELIDAKLTYHRDNDWKSYQNRIARRRFYLLKRKDGDVWQCPAVANSATAACSNKPNGPLFMGLPSVKQYAIVANPPQNTDRICDQASVKIRHEDLGTAERLYQDLQHGSQEWEDRYAPARSMVEGFNGYTKDGKHEQLDRRENRRVRGFAANALVATVALLASNCRKITSFLERGMPLPAEPKPRPRKGEFRGAPSWVRHKKTRRGWDADDGDPAPLAA